MEQKVALYKKWCLQNTLNGMGEILMIRCCEE